MKAQPCERAVHVNAPAVGALGDEDRTVRYPSERDEARESFSSFTGGHGTPIFGQPCEGHFTAKVMPEATSNLQVLVVSSVGM